MRVIRDHGMRNIRPALRLFQDERGTVAILFAAIALPLITAAAVAIDYSMITMAREQLQGVADSAALAAISPGSPGVADVAKNGTTGRLAAAEADARKFIAGELASSRFGDTVSSDIAVSYASGIFTSNVKLSASVATYFAGIIGINHLDIDATSAASYEPLLYTDFYILIDNSPSMALGATSKDISILNAKNGGCAFACHLTGSTSDAFSKAKGWGARLRIDSVSSAVKSMIGKAYSERIDPDQFRFAVYSLGATSSASGLTEISPMTTNLEQVADLAASVGIMTTPSRDFPEHDTDIKAALQSLSRSIGTGGSGVSAKDPQKVVFLISDGVEDAVRPSDCQKRLSGTRCQQPLDYRPCQTIKASGVKVVSLYTTYQQVSNNAWYRDWVAPFYPEIARNMQSCASDGLYIEVAPSSDVGSALTGMFAKVVSKLRITS